MSNSCTRREALITGAATLVGGVAMKLGAPQRAEAIEPIARGGRPKFKFSLAGYSYRDLFKPNNRFAKEALTLHEFADDCAKMQLEGTELTSYYFPPTVTNEYLTELRRHCFRLGLDVSGTAVGNDFCHPAGERRDREIASVKRWTDHAAVLGAPVIRIFSGSVKPKQMPEDAHRLAVAGIEECCDYAGQRGIHLALENHGGLTATAAGMIKLVQDVQSPWFGVNFDSGNFRSEDVYAELAEIAPYAINAQVKVVVSPRGQKKQPADFARLAKTLREAGYRGYIVLEYEESGDPRVECPKFIEQIREAFA
ncbi:MAG: sugar phosphate isomerase/epimerase family protein [Pirellulales bacterium]